MFSAAYQLASILLAQNPSDAAAEGFEKKGVRKIKICTPYVDETWTIRLTGDDYR